MVSILENLCDGNNGIASSEVLGSSAVVSVSLDQRSFLVSVPRCRCCNVRPVDHGKLVTKVSVLDHSQNQRWERNVNFKT